MRVSCVGPDGGLIEQVVDRLPRQHRAVAVDDDPEVVIDIIEPGPVDPTFDRAAELTSLIDRIRPTRYILISTVLVYAPVPDPRDWPILESFDRRAHGDPVSRANGQAGIDAEDAVIDAASRSGTEYVVLRPTVIVGARPDGFAERVLDDILVAPRRAARRYQGAGTMQWVDLDDVTDAILRSVDEPAAADETFTIAGPDAFTATDLAAAVTGWSDGVEDVSAAKFGTVKAATLLGWEPVTRLELPSPRRRPIRAVARW